MTKHNKPSTRPGLETCLDMYEKLQWESQRLECGWSVYDTFNFVVTVNHLYVDWIRDCGSQEAKDKKAALPEFALLVMQAVVDLSNGAKHWQMTKDHSLKNQVITKAPERGINDWHAYFISGPMLYVEFGDYKLSMRELRDQVLGYFKWIFVDGDSDFPKTLQSQFEKCRVCGE
ncbi:MAG: hypothetical protein Q8J80_06910 [Gallionella sp.]|nr:hypothetical protein [Gallionella sp.]